MRYGSLAALGLLAASASFQPQAAPYDLLLKHGRIVDGTTAADIGLVSLAVAPEDLDATVDEIAAEVAAVPTLPQQLNKEVLNTSLEIMGVGAMFRYHGQMNALRRLG